MSTDRTRALVLGVDGGGTSTRAVVCDERGDVVGAGDGGPSNIQVAGGEATRDAIGSAIEAACAAAGIGIEEIAAGFLGLAGVASEKDRAEIRSIVEEIGIAPATRIGIDHDLRIALAGGLGGAPGIVLIAGTGSSCYGRTADGSSWRAGGWGPLIDDVGSGYWLGVRALGAIARALDGRGAATALEERLTSVLAIADASELLRMTGRDGLSRDRIAALAPEILAIADGGDAVAMELVRSGIDELAAMAAAVVEHLDWQSERVPLVLAGGLASNDAYGTMLLEAIVAREPRIEPRASQLSPVRGAALLARELLITSLESL